MDLFPIQHRCAIGADKDNMKKTLLQLIKELLNTCTYWHKAEEEREHYTAQLRCLPLWSGTQISASQIPWQPHHWFSERESSGLWVQSHPCESCARGGTSKHSFLCLLCLWAASLLSPEFGPPGQSSNLSHKLGARRHQGHLHFPGCWKTHTSSLTVSGLQKQRCQQLTGRLW